MIDKNSEFTKYLPQIIEQATNGIIVSDPNSQDNPVIYVNEITCKRFGYSAEEFLGKNCRFLQGEDTNQKNLTAVRTAIKNKTSTSVTLRNYTKEGKLIYNQFSISPIFDDNNQLKYFLGIQRDVTMKVLLQEQNIQLQKKQLQDAQFNAIGRLTGGISHEINTPLTIINGTMEMLKESLSQLEACGIKENMSIDLHTISLQLNKIKNLTESMREIGDTRTFQMEDMNLYRALIIALRLTHHKAKNITKITLFEELFTLDIDREKHNYQIFADPRKMEQVIIAIIDNALDQLVLNGTTYHNRLEISITQNQEKTILSFSDNGGGVPQEILNDIFKPFHSNKSHKGLGIGLSIVKKIMDQHNFTIDVSNNTQGAVVTIEIPNKTS